MDVLCLVRLYYSADKNNGTIRFDHQQSYFISSPSRLVFRQDSVARLDLKLYEPLTKKILITIRVCLKISIKHLMIYKTSRSIPVFTQQIIKISFYRYISVRNIAKHCFFKKHSLIETL